MEVSGGLQRLLVPGRVAPALTPGSCSKGMQARVVFLPYYSLQGLLSPISSVMAFYCLFIPLFLAHG